MQGKDIKPKREKKTTISFPLINPEPITVPIMARNAEIQFFIYYFINILKLLEFLRSKNLCTKNITTVLVIPLT